MHIRYRSSWNANFKQGFSWGSGHILLCKRYKQLGLSGGSFVGRLIAIPRHSLACLLDRLQHRQPVWNLGWQLGMLRGYFRYGMVRIV